jgi:endonuclease/exonuclease/phosphatase family metal-dependent hydrolase
MAAMTEKLRVATWNVREGVPADSHMGKSVREDVIDLLRSYNVDLIGLQEVDFDGDLRSSVLEVVHAETPLAYSAQNVLSDSSFYPSARAGVALASRFPLRNIEVKHFRNPRLYTELNGDPIRSYDKGLVSATVVLGGGEFSAVSLHVFPFHLFGRDADDLGFRLFWSDLSAELAHFASRPLVALGDFNTPRRELVLAPARLTLKSAIIGKPTYKDKAFDDVLYTEDFELRRIDVLDNFSDHRLCIAEFTLKPSGISP